MSPRKAANSTLCTKCRGDLYAPGAFAGPSLVQGKLYCEPCAARLRIRTRAALLGAAALTLSGIGSGIALAATHSIGVGPSAWLLPFIAAAEYGLIFGSAIRWMKRRNLAAIRNVQALSLAPVGGALPSIARLPANER